MWHSSAFKHTQLFVFFQVVLFLLVWQIPRDSQATVVFAIDGHRLTTHKRQEV